MSITFSDNNAKVTVSQLDQVIQGMATKNDARFANINDVYTKTELDNKITVAYKAGGSKTGSELLDALLISTNEGKVYNVSTDFTTTSSFVEGAGKAHRAGTNVVVIEATPADNTDPEHPVAATYKFDVLEGGEVLATATDITNIINAIYAE